jgi:hypothetical protein
MGVASVWRVLFAGILAIFLPCVLFSASGAQGIQQSPYSSPSLLRGSSGGELDLAPSNPLASPGSSVLGAGGSSSLYVSDGMLRSILPLIPNLQFGYLYDYGNDRVRQGRFTADYLLPFSLSPHSMIFGEAHTEFQDFWKTTSINNRVDMSFGGGYRTIVKRDTLVGVNGFYDTSRLNGTWYSSGGVGLETVALVGSNDAIDLNFNWYGQIFNSNVILNAFRFGPSNYDFEAGYSHELWNGGPDLRLKLTGYKFDVGTSVYGWNGGVELKSRDGMFVVRYDVGNDKINQTYQTVGGFVKVGFQVENLLKGESPFTMPEPIFKSPRSLRYMLTQPVKRDWHQPAAVVLANQAGGGGGSSSSTLSPLTTSAILGVPIPTNSSVGFFLVSNVALSDAAARSTLTITFASPAPAAGGQVGLFTDTASFTGFFPVPAGATSVTISKATNPRFFGGGGITGTQYGSIDVQNFDLVSTWPVSPVILVWN